MAFTIPIGIFDLYQSVADEFINNAQIGESCRLTYPQLRVDCQNCVFDSINQKSSNIYQSGGTIPFTSGICPYCHGRGFIDKDRPTENIRLRIYWQKKDFEKISNIEIPAGDAMAIGFLTDMPKIERAEKIVIVTEVSSYKNYVFKLGAEVFPWGFGKDKYFVAHLVRKP